ncbi:MAG TPA: hypothetical protein VLK84_29345 [Longimicrobium sp.]|nr:hypothetical protein [Longimicrobium sp.]
MRRNAVTLLLAGIVATGCHDGSNAGAPTGAVAVAPQGADANVASLSHAIALALGDAGIREQVRNDMRDSRYSLHKLVLQEYVSTPGGQRLLAAAATAAAVSPDALAQRIAALPPLDFYVLLREHRMSWQGEAGVAVVTQLSTARTMVGHTERGVPVSYSFTTPAALNVQHTLFTLQVSELEPGDEQPVLARTEKSARNVIQASAGDDVGVIGVIIAPDGRRTTVDPRDARSVEAGMRRIYGDQAPRMVPEGGALANVTATATRGTIMHSFVQSHCSADIQDCWPNTMEIEHKTWLVDRYSKNTLSGGGIYLVRRTGVMEQATISETVYMSPYVPTSNGVVKLIRTETDDGPDDHYGPYYYDYNQDGYKEFTGIDSGGYYLIGTINFAFSYY